MPDTKITTEQVDRMIRAIVGHLQVTDIAKNHASFSEAMQDLGLWEFVQNQARVQAYAFQANTDLNNLLRSDQKVPEEFTDPYTWRK